jgi:uncharacterized protein YdiU (UPF0061 family)
MIINNSKMDIFNFDNTYLTLPGNFYDFVKPTQFENPELVLLNTGLCSELNIGIEDKVELLAVLSGQFLHKNSHPFAQAYAGHQFGHFTMLGDGRAIVLGEHVRKDNSRCDIQLKGAGRTAYSRGGDGKATLKAMLREYLMSEAMHHLNISTSRSLAVIRTGENVHRETINDGAVLTRVMKSHIRIGTFQYAGYFGNEDDLKALLNYTINRLYPDIKESDNPALSLLEAVTQEQIYLVTNWMRVGFIHGVMNTDNTSISGESFDYGPCAFLNSYDPQTVFSSIDTAGRYSFGNQPRIIKWNLVKLAQVLLPLIDAKEEIAIEKARQTIDRFDELWNQCYYSTMLDKLGIEIKSTEDYHLADELLAIMNQLQLDYTNTFAALRFEMEFPTKLSGNPLMQNWVGSWEKRIALNSNGIESAQNIIKNQNPFFIPRNHIVEDALTRACNGDFSSFELLLKILRTPYSYQKEYRDFATGPGQEFDNNYQTFCGT